MHSRLVCMTEKWCQLCAQPLGKYFFFVGGVMAARANGYFEPATHLDCLIYAMQVCPFIVGRTDHADIQKVIKAHPDCEVRDQKVVLAGRNPLWVIKKADSWTYIVIRGMETVYIRPHEVLCTVPLMPEFMTAADWKEVEKQLI